MQQKLPSKDHLDSRFDYDPITGKLFWKARCQTSGAKRTLKCWNTRYAGKEAGCFSFDALGKPRAVVVQLLFPDNKKRLVYAHRIILKMHSMLSDESLEVDHIDGDPFNNKLENLRLCSHLENGQNIDFSQRRKRKEHTKILPIGVVKRRKKFTASITTSLGGVKKKVHIGTFNTPAEAHRAYIRLSYALRGEFARKQKQ